MEHLTFQRKTIFKYKEDMNYNILEYKKIKL